MIASSDTSKIIPALVAALGQMEDIAKTRTANIQTKTGPGYKYTFADLSDVLGYARPLLTANGLAVFQEPFTDGNGTSVSTTILHTSGQWIESRPLRLPSGGDAQSHGSAITFARRYQLLAQLGLATEDDDGAAASKPAKAPRASKSTDAPADTTEPVDTGKRGTATESQIRALQIEFQKLGIDDRDERLKIAGDAIGHTLGSFNHLSRPEAARVFDEIENIKKERAA